MNTEQKPEAMQYRHGAPAQTCTCPSGDGSLRWPCPAHPPSAAPVVLPEPVAMRVRHRSETGMIGHYPWTYTERIRGGRIPPEHELEYIYTEHQVRELLANTKRSTNRDDESVGLREALVRAHDWMDSQADSQSKGGHATFDLMMLREERNAIKSALDESPQPQADGRDAAFEAVRNKLCRLQRYSFIASGAGGGVQRVKDRCGNWIEFDAAHELFDPVALSAAQAAKGEQQ